MGEVRSAREAIFFIVLLSATIFLLYTFQAEFQDVFMPIRITKDEIESIFGEIENLEEIAYNFESERSCNQTFYELTTGEGKSIFTKITDNRFLEGRLETEKLTGVHIFIRHGHRTAMDSKRAKKTPRYLCDIRNVVTKMMIDQKSCFT